MKIDCGTNRDRLSLPSPTICEVEGRYTLTFRLLPEKLDRLKVYLEHDRVVIKAEYLHRIEEPEGSVTVRVPYEQDFQLPSHVGRNSFFPLLDGSTLRLTLFVKEPESAREKKPVRKEAAHSC